jgi:hypothetical protein
METINLKLKNCYGVKSLECSFDFSEKSTYAIYAPNGTMKTSFAKTFFDISLNRASSDLVFTERENVREVTKEDGSDLLPNEVFVIQPYNEGYKSSKVSTLLVNQALRDEYEAIHNSLDEKKDELIRELSALSGTNKDTERLISLDIAFDDKAIFTALARLKAEVLNKSDSELGDVVYSKVLNAKTEGFLNTKDFKEKILEYMTKYNELIDASTYFKEEYLTIIMPQRLPKI